MWLEAIMGVVNNNVVSNDVAADAMSARWFKSCSKKSKSER